MSEGKGNPEMRRRSPHWAAPGLAAIALGLGAPAVVATPAHAQAEQTSNRLTRVEVRETSSATEIVVEGDRKPTFTVFKLSDPTRLFVDVSNADIRAVRTPIDVDNGVISQITALQFDDDLVSIGRLVIGLEVDALYSVKAVGNSLVITVDASQRKASRPVIVSQADPQSAAVAAAAEDKARAAEAKAREAEARARQAEARAETEAQARAQAEARAQALADEVAKAGARADAAAAESREAQARAEVASAEADRRAQEAAAATARAGADAADAETRAREAAVARERAQADALAAEQRAQVAAAEAESRVRAAQAEVNAATAQTAAAEARASDAEKRAEAALADARVATASADQRARAAEAKAATVAQEAETAEARAIAAAQALSAAQAATRAAEGRAAQAQSTADARVAEVAAAERAARDAVSAAEARAREADAAKAASQEATAAAQARSRESLAALEAARAAQTEAESRAQVLARSDVTARQQATKAEQRARELAAAADARAKEAAAAEARAQAMATQAESRAVQATATATARAEAAEQAEAQAKAAQARAQKAETRADAAEAKAREAERRAADAERARQRVEAELVAIGRDRAAAEQRIRDLETSQSTLATQLDTARAENNAATTARLEAETRAQASAVVAEKARLAQLQTAEERGQADQRVAELEAQLAKARTSASDAEQAARLEGDLEAARSEQADLAGRAAAREAALAQALSAANNRRAEADRLDGRAGTASTARTGTPAVGTGAVATGDGLPPPARLPSRKVTDVRFDDQRKQTRITVRVQGGKPKWSVRSEGERTRVLEIDGAVIDPALERSLDTAAFPSAVQLVSTFQAPPPGERVRVAVTLSTPVEDRISFANGQLEWTFAKPSADALQARALPIPPPPPAYAAAPAAGKTARNGAVGFEAPRAAAYVGMGQAAAAVPANQRARRVQKKYIGRKINIDIKDGDLHNILRLLAKEGNVNIVTSDEVKGTVTLHLVDVPWDQALDIILSTKGLGQVREGGIIRIDLREKLAKEREDEVNSRKVVEALKPLQVKLLSVNHADASELQKTVKGVLSARGEVQFDKRTNTLIIRDVDDHIEAAVDLVRRLDTQTSQVLLTARIVEVNTNDLKELGIQWGGQAISSPATGNATGLRFPGVIGVRGGADDQQTPTRGVPANPNFVVNLPAAAGGGSGGALGMTFGSIDGAFNLNVRLSALESRGSAKVVSQPRIATLDNVQATIKDGVRIPISQVSAAGIQTQFFNADLQLQATPQVTQDGNIYLKMKVTKATPDFQNVGARGDPTILTKEATTQLLLGDGETMVIGGIFSSNAGYSYAEVPYLGRIPILGALFRKYREDVRKSELLIFITTEIMNRRDSSVQTGP